MERRVRRRGNHIAATEEHSAVEVDRRAFSRAISICSAVNALARTSRSRPDASAFTQLSSDCAETPSVRATDDSF